MNFLFYFESCLTSIKNLSIYDRVNQYNVLYNINTAKDSPHWSVSRDNTADYNTQKRSDDNVSSRAFRDKSSIPHPLKNFS